MLFEFSDEVIFRTSSHPPSFLETLSYDSARCFARCFPRATIVRIGGRPGAFGNTLASQTYRFFTLVIRRLSTTFPIEAVPPGESFWSGSGALPISFPAPPVQRPTPFFRRGSTRAQRLRRLLRNQRLQIELLCCPRLPPIIALPATSTSLPAQKIDQLKDVSLSDEEAVLQIR